MGLADGLSPNLHFDFTQDPHRVTLLLAFTILVGGMLSNLAKFRARDKENQMKIDWEKVGGLLPVIVQESGTNEVLMLAYMNEEALNLSLKTGLAHYFSRTKGRIWQKGETSGNTQIINEIFLDCDNDTLLLKVTQNGGVACHTGEKSCFFRNFKTDSSNLSSQAQNLPNSSGKKPNYDIIDEIYHVILDRKLNADPKNSYVASLFKKGENAILKKVGEEATELVMACKDASAHQSKAQENGQILDAPKQSDTAKIGTNLQKQKIPESNVKAVDLAKLTNLKDQISPNLDPHGYDAANEQNADIIYEAADLCFHALIALALHDIHPECVKAELARRFGLSGIEEKNSRCE